MKEKIDRSKIIENRIITIEENPDHYYYGYWSNLAKQLNITNQMLNKIKNRIVKKRSIKKTIKKES